MAKSPQLDAVITLASALGDYDDSQGAIEGFRRSLEEMTANLTFDGTATYERVNAGGVPAEWVAAEGAAEDRAIIYVHGGGYVIGSVRTHRVLMSELSRASGAKVLGLEYRLAPEHPFPAPVEDTLAAYRWLLSEGFDPGRISIAGDSAGGGLTVAALVQIRYVGLPMAGAGVCISPWVDMEGTGDSVVSKAEGDPMVGKDGLLFMAGTYLAGADPKAPLAAPLYADLQGLAPLLIQVGTTEILLDDSTRLADLAKGAGVEVELEIWDDMIHVWHMFAPILPEGKQAIEQAADFIKRHTGG